jgi:3-isopropylmalate dehydrogenase
MHTRYRIGIMFGDGVGPEIVPAAAAVVDAAIAVGEGPAVSWVPLPMGHDAINTHGNPLPESTLTALTDTDGWVLGPHDSASYPKPFRSQLSPGGTLRKHFDLYANIRPAMALEGAETGLRGTDLVIVRENTQGFYADRSTFAGGGEFMPTPDIAIAMGIITRSATERIARTAFELSMKRKKRVTIVHKANVLPMTTGLFRDVCRNIGQLYPEVSVDTCHVDAMAAHLVRRGDRYDVIVAENMFGDILSDIAAEVAGSLGIAASINCSNEHAMAQAAHGSAPDIAGRGTANPIGIMLSSAMLLDWLSAKHADLDLAVAAERIRTGVRLAVLGRISTPDLGGSASTSDFTAAVLAIIGEGAGAQHPAH